MATGAATARMRLGLAAMAAALLTLLGACGGDEGDADPSSEPTTGSLPTAAQDIFDKQPYAAARWNYRVEDLDGGDVSLAASDGAFTVSGSTAKLFTIGALYDTLGTDETLSTPVYEVGGDLVLVGQGDLALGGRGATEGNFDYTVIDKVYADAVPGATQPPGDPLAGLRELAEQTAGAGVKRVTDVKVDDRLFEPFDGQAGTVTPIFVNDNQVEAVMTPTEVGEPVDVEIVPETDLYEIDVQVKTVAGDGSGESAGQSLSLVQSEDDPTKAKVTGTLEEGAEPAIQALIPPDPAAFARGLFIDELERAGVGVARAGRQGNDLGGLPEIGDYRQADEVASLESPTLEKFGSMILHTSYDDGANAMLCLLALDAGSTDCTDGLTTIDDLVEKAGIPLSEVVLIDGQGGDPASVTPSSVNAWIRWTTEQPWGEALEDGLPILGETGVLAVTGQDSPAKGKVAAKPGTSIHPIPPDGRFFSLAEGLAGFLDTDDGKKIFSVYMDGGIFPDESGFFEVGDDLAAVAAAFQQHPG